jgi:hypothetical protein
MNAAASRPGLPGSWARRPRRVGRPVRTGLRLPLTTVGPLSWSMVFLLSSRCAGREPRLLSSRPLLVSVEHRLHRSIEVPGEGQRQGQRRGVASGLDRVDRLSGDAHRFGELALREPELLAQTADLIPHDCQACLSCRGWYAGGVCKASLTARGCPESRIEAAPKVRFAGSHARRGSPTMMEDEHRMRRPGTSSAGPTQGASSAGPTQGASSAGCANRGSASLWGAGTCERSVTVP